MDTHNHSRRNSRKNKIAAVRTAKCTKPCIMEGLSAASSTVRIVPVPAVQMIARHKRKYPVLRLCMSQSLVMLIRISKLSPVRLRSPGAVGNQKIFLTIYGEQIAVFRHVFFNLPELRKVHITCRHILLE